MSTVLEVKNISKRYKNFLLDDVSFSLEMGTITGFIGENGAGKTTTLSAVMRLIETDSGQILYTDKEVKRTRDMNGISYLESNRELYPDISMKDYKCFVSAAYKNEWDEEKYIYYTKKFHIQENKRIKELSTGMKAKFYLAVELARQPKLLLLDEPTSGLDPMARMELLEIIKQLAEEEKVTIFFSSHITSDIDHIANNVVFIHGGKILLDMSKENINRRYKRVDMGDLQYLTEEQKRNIEENGVRNFEYYITDVRKTEQIDGKYTKAASLDDVLMFLIGGGKIGQLN